MRRVSVRTGPGTLITSIRTRPSWTSGLSVEPGEVRSVGDGDRRVDRLESRAPGRVARRPAELALGLRVRGAPCLGGHHSHGLACEQPREPGGEAPRGLRAEGLGEHRQPFAHRSGIVVDDVVDRRAVVFQGENGCGGGVVEVDPGPDAAAVADDRKLPLANRLDRAVVGGAVEGAVAQCDPAEVGDRLLEIGHRGGGPAEVLRRRGVERIVLGLDGSALAGVPGEGRNALRDESAYASLVRGRQQGVRSLRSQLAGLGRHLVHVPAELHVRQRGRLVDDRLGLVLEHGFAHRARVEQIEHDRLRAQRPQQL